MTFTHPIHHFQIQVSDLQRSVKFYAGMFAEMGFVKVFENKSMVEWSKHGTRILVVQSPEKYLSHGFHRKRIGLNHVAFRAESREAVDRFCRDFLVPNKIPVLYGGAREWAGYDPGYYAVYFEDPDRIKLELVYVPGDL